MLFRSAPGMGPALAAQVWEYFHPQEEDSTVQPPELAAGENGSPMELAG